VRGAVGRVKLIVVILHDVSPLCRNSASQKIVPPDLGLCFVCTVDFCKERGRCDCWAFVVYFGYGCDASSDGEPYWEGYLKFLKGLERVSNEDLRDFLTCL
jgi:hypothetical protein